VHALNRDPKATLAIVHRYFTPFALALVAVALIVSRPAGFYAIVAFGVLAFSAVFNWVTRRWAEDPAHAIRMREMRLGVNLAVNSFLVFLLISFWRPIWLLYVLTPVATGVYETRTRTAQMGGALAVLLVWAYWVNQMRSPADWAEALVHGAFIVFLSLFVNQVASPFAASAAESGS
jgi:hypothetical protein